MSRKKHRGIIPGPAKKPEQYDLPILPSRQEEVSLILHNGHCGHSTKYCPLIDAHKDLYERYEYRGRLLKLVKYTIFVLVILGLWLTIFNSL